MTRYSRGWLLVSVATNNVNSVHSIIAVVIKFGARGEIRTHGAFRQKLMKLPVLATYLLLHLLCVSRMKLVSKVGVGTIPVVSID